MVVGSKYTLICQAISADDSVAEAGSIMSLAPSGARGKYLALWIVARNVNHFPAQECQH